jgi:hypothetical protein
MAILGFSIRIGDSKFDRFLMELDDSEHPIDVNDKWFLWHVSKNFGGILGNKTWKQIIADSVQIPEFKQKFLDFIEGNNLESSLGKGEWIIKFKTGSIVYALLLDLSKSGIFYAGIQEGSYKSNIGWNKDTDFRPKSMGSSIKAGKRSSGWNWNYTDFITFHKDDKLLWPQTKLQPPQ